MAQLKWHNTNGSVFDPDKNKFDGSIYATLRLPYLPNVGFEIIESNDGMLCLIRPFGSDKMHYFNTLPEAMQYAQTDFEKWTVLAVKNLSE